MNNYTKDETEILDIPVTFRNIGGNTASYHSQVVTPSGLTLTVTMQTGNKSAVVLASGGSTPNTYDCKVYFTLSNGARRLAHFTITME